MDPPQADGPKSLHRKMSKRKLPFRRFRKASSADGVGDGSSTTTNRFDMCGARRRLSITCKSRSRPRHSLMAVSMAMLSVAAAFPIRPTDAFLAATKMSNGPLREKSTYAAAMHRVPEYLDHSQRRRLLLRPTTTTITTTTNHRRNASSLGAALAPASQIGGTWCASLASKLSSARSVLHADASFVLSSVLLLSVFGITLERRTTLGKALSAPLATMALTLIVANLGLVPFSSPIYTTINQFLVPLAVPLLLFDSDLRRVIADTGTLLIAFFVGAVSTIVGTLVAFHLVPMKALGTDQGWRIASALAARHIGGAINFVAVADTLDVSGSAVSSAIAADNVIVALYFAFLFYLAKYGEEETGVPSSIEKASGVDSAKAVASPVVIDPERISGEGDDAVVVSTEGNSSVTMATLGISMAVASCIVTIGKILSKLFLPAGTSSLPVASVLTVAAATAFPAFFSRLRTTGSSIGILFMQMFFAASGAAGSIVLVLRSAPSLFFFSAMQIGVHFITLVTVGRVLCRLDANELYLASNANVGGPTTAAAMAQAKNWKRLVLPALLIGILGYATATPIALALGPMLLRLSGL